LDSDNATISTTKTRFVTPGTANYGGEISQKVGILNGATSYDKTTELSVTALTIDGTSNATYETKTLRSTDGVNYTPTQNNDVLGRFTFLGNYATGTAPLVSNAAGNISVSATEAWTASASGVAMKFNVNKTGTNTAVSVLDLAATASTFRSDQFNLLNTTTALDVSNIKFNTGNPSGAGFVDRVSQLRVQTASTVAGEASTITFNTGNYNTGTGNFSATQTGDVLGDFFFSGNYGTGTTFTSLSPSVKFSVRAAENFTGTNNGGQFLISVNKIGGSTPYDAISIDSSNAKIASDTITLESNTGTDYAVLNANTAKFNVPVTTELTTTTISEGTTYTPAATVDNNISVQIDTLAGGTTVIDLASLTGNTRGASYNILVFNNTASGTPIQVKNTRINSNNLMTHTITTGSPRIIINAYVVGDYATATHLVVA